MSRSSSVGRGNLNGIFLTQFTRPIGEASGLGGIPSLELGGRRIEEGACLFRLVIFQVDQAEQGLSICPDVGTGTGQGRL